MAPTCRETDPGVEMCAKASKYGAARPTEEVGHHRVQPAAGLGTQRVASCLVGDECGTIAKVEQNHADDQAGEVLTARRDKRRRPG